MKPITSIIATLALLPQIYANTAAQTGKITEVTVFVQGAQITRNVSFNLEKGSGTYVVTGLSPQVDENTIRVGGKGNFTLLSVSKRTDYLSATPKPKEMVLLEDTLQRLNASIHALTAKEFGLTEEKNLIINNKSMRGEDATLTADQLKAMSAFFRERLASISQELFTVGVEKKALENRRKNVQYELNVFVSKRNRPMTEVVLELLSKTGGTAALNLMYQVNDAGWTPSYDLRTSGKGTELDVTSYASVYQGTGVDWENVNLTLSTNYPRGNNQKLELHPWVLRFVQSYYQQGLSNRKTVYAQPAAMDMAEAADAEVMSTTAADFTRITQNTLNAEYKIDLPYSIASTRKDHKVMIRETQLPAKLNYYVAPKLDKQAFLVAGVTQWESENLLPGESRQFVDGTYMGKGFLNTQTTKDTLLVSMGVDQDIRTDRKRIKDYAEKTFMGGKKIETIGIEITVRNTKAVGVEIRVEDQYPISSDETIEVSLEEKTGATVNAQTGLMHWDLNLAPGTSKTLRFVYKVKYPKDKVINL